jgi:hypothetical protein
MDPMGKPTPVLLGKGWNERQDADGAWFVTVRHPGARITIAGSVLLLLVLCYGVFALALFRGYADIPWWAYAIEIILAYFGVFLVGLGGGITLRLDGVGFSRSGGRFAIVRRIVEETANITEFRAVERGGGPEIWDVAMVTRDYRTVRIFAGLLHLRPEAEEAAARLSTMLNDVKQTRQARGRGAAP